MKKTIQRAYLAVVLLTLMGTVASAQTGTSVAVGGGRLAWQIYTGNSIACNISPNTYIDYETTNFTFTAASGTVTSFPGATANYYAWNGECAQGVPDGAVPAPLVLNGTSFIIDFTAGDYGYAGNVTYTAEPPATSTFGPLYKVVSILYSPPGNQSAQGFGTSTTDGTSTTIGSSFSFSEVLTFTSGIPNVLSGSASTGYTTTSNNSSAFTQTWTDATTVTTDDNSNTTYNPTKSDAVNHNLDSFVIWLNPEVTVISYGGSPASYTTGSQVTSGVSAVVADVLPPLPAITMEATPAGVKGVTTVPVAYLVPQAIAGENGKNSYMPGLGAICKNNTLYKDQLASANPSTPVACTQANQCGCAPSDFVAILQTDPLLNYNGTTYTASPYAGTESPLELDVSGASVCGGNPVVVTANCRYVIVPIEKGSTTTTFETLSGSAGITFTQSDATTKTETIGGSTSHSVGISFGGGPIFADLKTADTWTWTDSQSTGNSTSEGNSMSVTFKTSDTDCEENVNMYEDTEYHTYAFQVPTGITTCP
ncbi:MAG: hypothetical protein WBV55_22610 [Candidatus Sulfotelmatobacter sp.]